MVSGMFREAVFMPKLDTICPEFGARSSVYSIPFIRPVILNTTKNHVTQERRLLQSDLCTYHKTIGRYW